jgi:hypothetical protein
MLDKRNLCAHVRAILVSSEDTRLANRPHIPAKEIRGNAETLDIFTRRIMQVPHSAIKAKLEAEKRTPKPSASRASHVPSNEANP